MRNKTRIIVPGAVLTVWLALFGSFAGGQSEQQKQDTRYARVFMRQKLVYSQNILEGLALGTYDLIITNGTLLSDMAQNTLWQVAYTDEYKQKSAAFRDNVIAMVAAAREKDIPAARKAYGKTLESCYDCHSHFLIDKMEKHQYPKKQKSN